MIRAWIASSSCGLVGPSACRVRAPSTASVRFLATTRKGKGRRRGKHGIKLSKPDARTDARAPFRAPGPPRYGIGAEEALSKSDGIAESFDARNAFGILVVFPILALGVLIMFNDGLQEQFMQSWDRDSYRAAEAHRSEERSKAQAIIDKARDEVAITAGLPRDQAER